MSLLTIPSDTFFLLCQELSLRNIRALGRTCSLLYRRLFSQDSPYWIYWYRQHLSSIRFPANKQYLQAIRDHLSNNKRLLPSLAMNMCLRKGYEKCISFDLLNDGTTKLLAEYQHWDILSAFVKRTGDIINQDTAVVCARYGQRDLVFSHLDRQSFMAEEIHTEVYQKMIEAAVFGNQLEMTQHLILRCRHEISYDYCLSTAIRNKNIAMIRYLQSLIGNCKDILWMSVQQKSIDFVKAIVESVMPAEQITGVVLHEAMCQALADKQYDILEYLLMKRKAL